MRQFIIAAAMALGLVAVWAAILPLTAQPAPPARTVASAALTRALFLCRGANGIDGTCARTLAKALTLDANEPSTSNASDRSCRADPQTLVSLERRG